MTRVTYSGSEEHFTGDYADPKTCTYYAYRCCYCTTFFYLVDPKTFQAMGCTQTAQYRNKKTGKVEVYENRSEGVCLDCAREIMRRRQQE
jgi:hypothetical protein